jgi:predicted DsbA family dithiol-disulfide isomerase
MAVEFPNVVADVIEASEFPDLSRTYGVTGVPKIVINDKVEFVGAVPEQHFVAAIQHAVGQDSGGIVEEQSPPQN